MTDCAKPCGFYALASGLLAASLLATELLAIELAAPDIAAAQTPQQSPAAATPLPAPQRGLFPTQPPPTYKPGFIYEFGRWWDTTRGRLDNFRERSNETARNAATATHDAMEHAAEATRDAAKTIVRLPGARVIEIRERCQLAPNGAPDCRTAATKACRVKGFNDGHPVDVQSSQNCPPAIWMSGREPTPGECPEETVVLLAACD